MKTLRINRETGLLLLLIIVFGLIYSLISLVNHFNFRTYALDLGAYTNALYDYIHLQWNDSTTFKPSENLLADHFDLYLMLFSPLSLLFGSYTLLLVQILSILLGGVGVYAYFKTHNPNRSVALWATLYFYSFFAVYTAVSFDYHSNVVAAMLLPVFFYFIRKRSLVKASVLLLLILVSKENIALWMLFVGLGLAVEYRKDTRLRNYLLGAAAFSAGYFVLITGVVMPAISNAGKYPHFHYAYLGHTSSEALIQLLTHPWESFKILFTNHTRYWAGDYVKLEVHLTLVACGLPLLFRKPQYLLMLIPIYFQKMYNDDYSVWSIGGQYSIEFAPIMAIGVFEAISSFRNEKLIRILALLVTILTLAATIRVLDRPIFRLDNSKITFYQGRHFQKPYPVKPVHEQLSKIPKDAVVSAQSPFLPHLALRDTIYQFPTIEHAGYIVVSPEEGTYPIPYEDFMTLFRELKESKDWTVIYDDRITILKRVE